MNRHKLVNMSLSLSKSLAIPTLTVSCFLTASTAMAQEVVFEEVDLNRNGFLDETELLATFGEPGLILLDLDQDLDGLVSVEEVRAGRDGTGDDDGQADNVDDDDLKTDDGGTEERATGDANRGHGNDLDGFDEDNPGRGHGDDGAVGGGRDRNDDDHADENEDEDEG